MFRDDVIDPDDQRLAEAGLAAYGVLEDTVAALAERYNQALPVREAARLCWSAMQGLVELHVKFSKIDALHAQPTMSLDEHVDRFTQLMLKGLLQPTTPSVRTRRPR